MYHGSTTTNSNGNSSTNTNSSSSSTNSNNNVPLWHIVTACTQTLGVAHVTYHPRMAKGAVCNRQLTVTAAANDIISRSLVMPVAQHHTYIEDKKTARKSNVPSTARVTYVYEMPLLLMLYIITYQHHILPLLYPPQRRKYRKFHQ